MKPTVYEIEINKAIGRKEPVRLILQRVLEMMAGNRAVTRFAEGNGLTAATLHDLTQSPERSPYLLTVEQIFDALGYRLTLEAKR